MHFAFEFALLVEPNDDSLRVESGLVVDCTVLGDHINGDCAVLDDSIGLAAFFFRLAVFDPRSYDAALFHYEADLHWVLSTIRLYQVALEDVFPMGESVGFVLHLRRCLSFLRHGLLHFLVLSLLLVLFFGYHYWLGLLLGRLLLRGLFFNRLFLLLGCGFGFFLGGCGFRLGASGEGLVASALLNGLESVAVFGHGLEEAFLEVVEVLVELLGLLVGGGVVLAHWLLHLGLALRLLQVLLSAEFSVEYLSHDFLFSGLESLVVEGAAQAHHGHGALGVSNGSHGLHHRDGSQGRV